MKYRKTILLLGGYNHMGSMIIERILENNSNYNLIIYDNLSCIMRYKNLNNIQQDYGYLENDILSFVYGDIKDYSELHRIFDIYNIHYVINNIKYNPRNEYEKSILNLKIGYANILELCEKNNCKLVNIQREITHKSIYLDHTLHGDESLFSSRYIKLQNEMTNDTSRNVSTSCIFYRDYLYDTYIDYSYDIIQKLVYMEKIKTTPFYPNEYAWFCNTRNVLDKIFNSLNDTTQFSTIYITQNHLHITLDIKPLIKSAMQECHNAKQIFTYIDNKDIMKYLYIRLDNK